MAALVITLVLMSLAALIPVAASRLSTQPVATPRPTPSRTPPPVAVLLPDERDRALQGVVIIANDHTFGSAFLIDTQGDLLTAASLIANSQSLRLIDNTGGMHQVRVLGIDADLGVALLRATVTDGVPLSFGDASTLVTDAPVEQLASPKLLYVQPATPGVITSISDSRIKLRIDDLPGNLGGPIVGSGGKVLAMLTAPGAGVVIDRIQSVAAPWAKQSGTLLPLAPLPANLVLRGSDTTASPPPSPTASSTARVTVQSVSPSRASAAQDIAVTIQGSGFVAGSSLRVHFVPVSGTTGAFDGFGAAVLSSSTLTLKVPSGRMVQDYVIQLSNGDGALINSQVGFTVAS
ncbi:MAG TPA: trypsin-like peptidase domain-containing protein [Candidatus Dormibacteraeota bacterium]|nr:trypsin-like peptidase domain-containing protein [Candidatus Dormibacteraeota bacterium]